MRIDIVAFSTNGCATALRVGEVLRGEDVRLFSKTSSDSLGIERIEGSVREWTGRAFDECDAIVFVGATGIAVRHIAPFIRSKDSDPAVVCMDEHGRWAIALLSGHIGGCNLLTQRIADGIGAEPIVTTATDLNGKFSVDTFAVRNGLRISSLGTAKEVSARVLDGRFVGFHSDIPVEGEFPDGISPADSGEFGVCVSSDPENSWRPWACAPRGSPRSPASTSRRTRRRYCGWPVTSASHPGSTPRRSSTRSRGSSHPRSSCGTSPTWTASASAPPRWRRAETVSCSGRRPRTA